MDRQEPQNSGLQLAGELYTQCQLSTLLGSVAVREPTHKSDSSSCSQSCSVIWREQWRALALKGACHCIGTRLRAGWCLLFGANLG
jgi:hypothetical protein